MTMETETPPPVDPGAPLDSQDPSTDPVLPLPRQGEGYADVVELHHRPHRPEEAEQDAREVYERLRRDLEATTGRGGRPWHMLTPADRDQWMRTLKMLDPHRP